jgi:hypothetical protein
MVLYPNTLQKQNKIGAKGVVFGKNRMLQYFLCFADTTKDPAFALI